MIGRQFQHTISGRRPRNILLVLDVNTSTTIMGESKGGEPALTDSEHSSLSRVGVVSGYIISPHTRPQATKC